MTFDLIAEAQKRGPRGPLVVDKERDDTAFIVGNFATVMGGVYAREEMGSDAK